jgi:hypothetical protein
MAWQSDFQEPYLNQRHAGAELARRLSQLKVRIVLVHDTSSDLAGRPR